MICAHCGKEIERRGPRQKYCPECAREVHRLRLKEQYRQERESILDWLRRYYAANSDKITARKREQRAANPEKFRQYGRRYYAEHHEKLLAYHREYRQRKKITRRGNMICAICGKECAAKSTVQKYCTECAGEVQREQMRQWHAAHRDKVNAYYREYRRRKKSQGGTT